MSVAARVTTNIVHIVTIRTINKIYNRFKLFGRLTHMGRLCDRKAVATVPRSFFQLTGVAGVLRLGFSPSLAARSRDVCGVTYSACSRAVISTGEK